MAEILPIRRKILLTQSINQSINFLVVVGTPCYSNNLACHPAAGDMRSALKIKIHNAINSAILADSEDRGIFVGGRRRNRKKKRTKHGNITFIRTGSSRCMLQGPSDSVICTGSSNCALAVADTLYSLKFFLHMYFGHSFDKQNIYQHFCFPGGLFVLFVFCFCGFF